MFGWQVKLDPDSSYYSFLGKLYNLTELHLLTWKLKVMLPTSYGFYENSIKSSIKNKIPVPVFFFFNLFYSFYLVSL